MGSKEWFFVNQVGGGSWDAPKTEMQLFRADWPAKSVDFVLAFRPHSDLLAKMPTLSARPVYLTQNISIAS